MADLLDGFSDWVGGVLVLLACVVAAGAASLLLAYALVRVLEWAERR